MGSARSWWAFVATAATINRFGHGRKRGAALAGPHPSRDFLALPVARPPRRRSGGPHGLQGVADMTSSPLERVQTARPNGSTVAAGWW